jgi:hypothetical protein
VTQPAALAALALQQVAAALSTLTAEQLAALADGRARLVYSDTAPAAETTAAGGTAPAADTAAAGSTAPAAGTPDRPSGAEAHPARAETAAGDPLAPGVCAAWGGREAATASVQSRGVDVAAVVADISALSSRDEVTAYLRARDRQLSVPALRQIARGLGPTVSAAARSKADLHRNIVEGTAGFRERSAAMAGRGGW